MEERGYKLYVPEDEEPSKDSEVFFNPEMILNRDLSEVAAKVFRDKTEINELRVCDPLAGSGIRGFRYGEISSRLVLNDANPNAEESIKKGLEENKIDGEVYNKDANVLLSEFRNYFHIIDVDPFGPFTNYLDSTARSANHQSFVGLTATDNAAPTGSYPKTCRRRYSSKPLKNSFMHETALRIYIKEVFENFARFDKAFEPRICFHEKHYSRIMGRVTESKKRTNGNLENIGYLSFCPECRWRDFKRINQCDNCGSKTKKAGPLWTGKISDIRFTEDMIEEIPDDWEDTREFLEMVHSEGEIITPFYDIHELSSNLSISVPKREKVISSIRDKGYPVSRTHFSPTGFRTDAPINDIRSTLENL